MLSRLTSKHPLAIKIRQAEQLLNKLGLRIESKPYEGFVIIDEETGTMIRYRDLEDRYNSTTVGTFPYFCETQLIIGEPE